MNIKHQSLSDLEKGIKHLLSEDRCSFSTDEKALLLDCLFVLQNLSKQQKTDCINLDSIGQFLDILIKVFVISNQVIDTF